MKDPQNIAAVAALEPQFMGFILYSGSPRYVSLKEAFNLLKNIPASIQKTAVLVNEPFENALRTAKSGIFDLIQLHGNESIEYCQSLSQYIRIIKAFSIKNELPHNLAGFKPYCSMFLFDTEGSTFGGTGKMFDHSILNNYSSETDFFLSGGISPGDSAYIKSISSERMKGIDLNSRFEIKPGIKDINLLKNFIDTLRNHDENDQ